MKTLDQWVHENALKLRDDIITHVETIGYDMSSGDQESLIRAVLISVRDWTQTKGLSK